MLLCLFGVVFGVRVRLLFCGVCAGCVMRVVVCVFVFVLLRWVCFVVWYVCVVYGCGCVCCVGVLYCGVVRCVVWCVVGVHCCGCCLCLADVVLVCVLVCALAVGLCCSVSFHCVLVGPVCCLLWFVFCVRVVFVLV